MRHRSRGGIRSHRRGVTAGGFLTGLGGAITLPVLLPNLPEQAAEYARRVDAVLKGESLFNDGVGVVLFTLLLGFLPGLVSTDGQREGNRTGDAAARPCERGHGGASEEVPVAGIEAHPR